MRARRSAHSNRIVSLRADFTPPRRGGVRRQPRNHTGCTPSSSPSRYGCPEFSFRTPPETCRLHGCRAGKTSRPDITVAHRFRQAGAPRNKLFFPPAVGSWTDDSSRFPIVLSSVSPTGTRLGLFPGTGHAPRCRILLRPEANPPSPPCQGRMTPGQTPPGGIATHSRTLAAGYRSDRTDALLRWLIAPKTHHKRYLVRARYRLSHQSRITDGPGTERPVSRVCARADRHLVACHGQSGLARGTLHAHMSR